METAALERVLVPAAAGGRGAWGVGIALLVHMGLVAAAASVPPVPPAPVAVTQVALLPPTKEPLAPAPAPSPLDPTPPARPVAPRRARAPRRSAQPAEPPARAGALRTVDEAVATPETPVRFVTDPSGAGFGYGSVARGGSAASASPAAGAAEAAAAAAGGTGSAPVLSRPPRLSEADPCRGFFPARARADRGEVALRVRVEADGSVRAVSVARESPVGHGFGFAARDCLLSKQFSPALDKSGVSVAVVSPVTVRFSR